jgi:hypothetical protein
MTHWLQLRRTYNHIFLSYLRLPQHGRPGSRIHIPQEQGGPVIPPGIGFPLRRFLRLARLWWRHSNSLRTWKARSTYIYHSGTGWSSPNSKSKSRYDRRSVSHSLRMSWCLVHAALEGLHPNEFESHIRRGTLQRSSTNVETGLN